MRDTKGITLITLVITIIVLLILASVSIAQLKSNGLFEKAKLAREISDRNEGEELLKTKIYEYQIYSINKNETTTLEGLKEYLKSDKEIENIDLYIGIDKLEPIKEGETATYAKVKLKKYKYEYILNSQLEIIKENKQEENLDLENINIDLELEALLKEANMTITLEDILNTPEIMNNVKGLIQTVTENDITRNETEGVVTYVTNKGEMIRTNSEDSRENYHAWKAFDGKYFGIEFALSKKDKVVEYYLEYEFKQNVYAMKIDFKFHNGTSSIGTRDVVIQGYDEENKVWMDLTKDITITGGGTVTGSTFPLIEENLNYSKSYKKYRLYVKNATGAGFSGLLEMQLYGGIASKIDKPSEENLKKLLLSNSTIDKITLQQMISNKEFKKRLINSLSINTVKNNKILMDNLNDLINVLTENDVTRSEVEGVVTYVTNKEEIIRTNSEDSRENYHAWKAFDGKYSGIEFALSKKDKVVGYYLEYEFKQNVYAMKIDFKFHNGTSSIGTRDVVIQGYDEENKVWIDLTKDITITGGGTATGSTFPLIEENLNYSKSYKKYRLYVKNATGAGFSGLLEMKLYGKIE